ncbi:MAG: pilus assembly protein PilM [Candidatus Omnitrophica bacterium]|nr:pilus assembly protein PilM [Candidatus Omnitrophota bacterium]
MKAIKEQLKKESKALLLGLGIGAGSQSVIGLDLGLKDFRAVRVKKADKKASVKDSLAKPMGQLKDLNKELHIDEDESVSINFTSDNMAIRRASIPLMPKEEIEEALRWELKEQVQLDISQAKIKFDILGEKVAEDGSKKIELIAIVYKEKEIEEKIKELKGLGLNVQGVFPSDFALAGYIDNQKIILSQEKVGLVDIGGVKTTIGVIENGKLCFARDVAAVGGDTITEAMTGVLISDKGKMDLSKEEAEKIKHEQGISSDIRIFSMMRPVLEKLANQTKRSLEYYEHRFQSDAVKKIILAGSGSKLKGLKEFISKETSLEVIQVLPENSCATGLALISDSSLNLLPKKFKAEKKAALKKVSVRMVSIALGLVFLFSYMLLSVRAINLNNELGIYRSYWQSIKDVASIKDRTTLFGYAISRVSHDELGAGKIMKELSNVVPSFVMLESLDIRTEEPNVALSGIIRQGDKLSEFMLALENSVMFEKAKLIFSEKNEDYSSGALDFEIVCNLTR